jgi:phosphatidate cytidylyltransferase
MSDDMWRAGKDRDDFSEYGSLFDDAEPTQNIDEVRGKKESDQISFGASDTGKLPHWTDPPTGEVPRLEAGGHEGVDDDELDVWSSFSSESPVWQDDDPVEAQAPAGDRNSGQQRRVSDDPARTSGQHKRVSGESEVVTREPSRITIGTDPSGIPRRSPTTSGRRRGTPPPGTSRSRTAPPQKSGRDMPVAIAVGLLIAAVFLAALMYKPWAVAVLGIVIIGLAAVEFYDKVSEKGYRPAVIPGIVTCVAAPVAAYWLGDGTLPLVIAFGFMATAASFIGARSVEPGRCRTCRSRRSGSCGSACSARSEC